MWRNCISTNRVARLSSTVAISCRGRKWRYSVAQALQTESVVQRNASEIQSAGEGELARAKNGLDSTSVSVPPYRRDVNNVLDKDVSDSQEDISRLASEDEVGVDKPSNVLGRINDSAPRLNPYLFLDIGSPLRNAALMSLVAALYIYTKESDALGGLPVFDVVFRLIGLWTVLWGLRTVLQAKRDAQR